MIQDKLEARVRPSHLQTGADVKLRNKIARLAGIDLACRLHKLFHRIEQGYLKIEGLLSWLGLGPGLAMWSGLGPWQMHHACRSTNQRAISGILDEGGRHIPV